MDRKRIRAPSARSLQTRKRILDAAEQVFAARGFEGASIREIAARAGVPVGLVNHHGGSKEELFHETVARRAEELSRLRIRTLEARKAAGPVDLRDLLECFVRPYVTLAQTGGEGWLAYGHLVAHVSVDPRWRHIAAECFDPTATFFLDEISELYPDTPRQALAAGQVYSVAAMLAFLNSGWRIEALSPGDGAAGLDELIDYCTAGFAAMIKAGDRPDRAGSGAA